MVLSDHHTYARKWMDETAHLDGSGIYEKLVALLPRGRVLEVGCGAGRGTSWLAKDHDILALDNNADLIEEASKTVAEAISDVVFRNCDLFSLSGADKEAIRQFSPNIIAAWFIGGSGTDVLPHTTEQPDPMGKGKLYREKIEDIIVSGDLLVNTVDTISLVNRSGRISHIPDDEVINDTVKDYNTHVFDEVGFEVAEVRLFDWPLEGSNFVYGAANNPNLATGTSVPTIVSIVARRK
ncbi:class I SAM-dependent methyltransferase [Sphingomonas faeni]|uniref:class I SAM-dependent methyltransferase n=1 Tax=Sphingomonas faeni TaxID=185950 RepID=UPI00241366CB|nr:class I SAM-dependent methyltransferase [Sphingomonas faeni]